MWWGRPLKTPFLMEILAPISIGIALTTIFAYGTWVMWPFVGYVFMGLICAGIFLFYISYYVYYKDWRDTGYMVTNQRVFFETLSGYADVNLDDVRDVYVKRGLRDRIYGTGRLFVGFRDFQYTTKFWNRAVLLSSITNILRFGPVKKFMRFKK